LGGLLGDFAWPLGMALAGISFLLFVAGTVASIVALIPPTSDEAMVLRPGARLGKGPYRSYDCTLSQSLVEGIVASVESAADGLSDTDRQRTLDRATAARRVMAGGNLAGALAEAAAAIAIYKKAVVSARNDDTLRNDDD